MRRAVFSVAIGMLAVACDGDVTSASTHLLDSPAATSAAASAHNVSITASVGGRSSAGDSVAIHIHNDGPDAAFLPRCGSQPLLLVQQFMNGQWTGGVQNFMCVAPSAPGPVQLSAGESIDVVRVFQAGRFRITASVATTSDLSNSITAVSNAFDAP